MNNLGHRARLSVLWNTGFTMFRDILQFGLTLVLVRLLTPEDYGQSGVVSAVVGFLMILSFRSFLLYALQTRREEEVDFQLHFTAGAVIQSSLFVVTNLVAFGLRWLPAYAEVAPLLHVASIVILLDCPSEIRVKMLERALDWKRLRLLHSVGILISAIAALVLAWAGAGVWALIVPSLFKSWPCIYDLFVAQRWKPDWSWDAPKFAVAWRFGLSRLGSGVAQYGRPLLESLLLVHLLGYAAFGLYGRAAGLVQLVLLQFPFLLMQSMYPVLTKIEPGTNAYRRAGSLVLRCVSWIIIPMGSVLAILADPVIQTIYGERWLDAATLLPWVTAAGAAGALSHSVYMLLLADQQPKRCLVADAWLLIGTSISLWLLLPMSIPAYLLGVTLTHMAAFVVLLFWLYGNHFQNAARALGVLVQPASATVIALLLCEWLKRLGGVELATFGPALAYATGFALVYLAIVRLLFAPLLREMVVYFPAANYLTRLLVLRA